MAALLEYRIWPGEYGASDSVRHRTWQRSTRRAFGSKWLFLSAFVDKSLTKRRGRHHRLVHASCGGNIVPCLGSARQPMGSAEDRRGSAGANTLVWREMLGGLSRGYSADVW